MDTHVDKLKAKIEGLPDRTDFKHRLHRAVSWLRRGAGETDGDAKYIFLWIAFNAAYVVNNDNRDERSTRRDYFNALIRLDGRERIYRLLATELLTPVLDIMDNEYLFDEFWRNLPEPPINWRDWPGQKSFEGDRSFVESRLPDGPAVGSQPPRLRPNAIVADNDVAGILNRLFSRLYVLRNQLMHGCATQKGSLNRRQVDTGAMVLGPLVCVFLEIMLDNPLEKWGEVSYPVRPDIHEAQRKINK